MRRPPRALAAPTTWADSAIAQRRATIGPTKRSRPSEQGCSGACAFDLERHLLSGRRSARSHPRQVTSPFGMKASIVPNTCRPPVAYSCCTPGRCPTTLTTATRCGTLWTAPRHSPAVQSSGPMSTRATAATTRKIPAALSSAPSSLSCAAALPLSPSSDTSKPKDTSAGATSRASPAMPPTSSSPPSGTTILSWFRELLRLLFGLALAHAQPSTSAQSGFLTVDWLAHAIQGTKRTQPGDGPP
ncbi:hypothetical protein ACVIW0_007483 [Bradyrhizobium sp. USDA 4454]